MQHGALVHTVIHDSRGGGKKTPWQSVSKTSSSSSSSAAVAFDELAAGILTYETNFGNTSFGRGPSLRWAVVVDDGGTIEQMPWASSGRQQ